MLSGRSLVLILAVSPLLAAMPGSAEAQCRLCSTPSTLPEQTATGEDVRLEIETNLDFDRLIVDGGGGDATLRPDGSRLATGAIALGPRTKVATVTVHGLANRVLRIRMRLQILFRGMPCSWSARRARLVIGSACGLLCAHQTTKSLYGQQC